MISLNVKPHIPKEVISVGRALKSIGRNGASLNLHTNCPKEAGFNEGVEYLIKRFKEESLNVRRDNILMPSLWMLAHAYVGSDEAKHFFDEHFCATSTAKGLCSGKNGEIYLGHSIEGYSNGAFETGDYSAVIQIRKDKYPESDISLEEFINKYTSTAKAIFLMNDSQVESLLNRMPNFPFDSERPLRQGTGFVDTRNVHYGIGAYFFGSRVYGKFPRSQSQDDGNFFGVTGVQEMPIETYPVSIGKKNEIRTTFEPEDYLQIAKAYKLASRNPTKTNLRNLGMALRIN